MKMKLPNLRYFGQNGPAFADGVVKQLVFNHLELAIHIGNLILLNRFLKTTFEVNKKYWRGYVTKR